MAEKFEQLLDNFRQIPYRGISLTGWAQHGDDIQKCLGLAGTGNVEDFARLNRQILQRCAKLLGADYTNEERLEGYQDLLGQIKGYDKTEGYARKVGEAIQAEIARIASGVRLSICLDDQKAATDGYVPTTSSATWAKRRYSSTQKPCASGFSRTITCPRSWNSPA